MPNDEKVKPADAGQSVGSSSYSCVRGRPGREYIAPCLPEGGLLSSKNNVLMEAHCLLDKAGAAADATTGRAPTSSTGKILVASAYDLSTNRSARGSERPATF